MSEWQTIEKAPLSDDNVVTWSVQDGTNIAHRHQRNPALSAKDFWVVQFGYEDHIVHPTHWMPLPAPPTD